MEALRPNKERAKFAIILIFISMAIDIIALLSDYMQYNLLSNAANGLGISTEDATINDLRQQLINLTNLTIIIVSGIVFIRWFRRAYFNLHQKTDYLTESEGWAAGAWFVPVLSWFRPFQIMRDLYVETDKILMTHVIDYKARTNMFVLVSWWTIWILNGFIGSSLLRGAFNVTTIDGFISNTISHMVLSFLGIPLAFLTVHLVKKYSEMETLLIEMKDESSETMNNTEVILVPAN